MFIKVLIDELVTLDGKRNSAMFYYNKELNI